MTARHDVVVIGLGAHGSAIAAHCAAAGLDVCGIDSGDPPHGEGSHHGESRIIRKAYYEHPTYVPLLERAYVLWDALSATTAETLLQRTGGLMIGPSGGELVPGALHSAREHRLEHEWLSRADVLRQFPDFVMGDGMEAVFEPEAGVLRPEACIRAHLRMAAGMGAVLRTRCLARIGSHAAGDVEIGLVAQDGAVERVRSSHCIVAAGAGLVDMGLPLSRHVVVERQVIAHFLPASEPPERMRSLPVFAIEEPDGRFFYGFPDLGSGVKVAQHHGGEQSARNDIDTAVRPSDIENLAAWLRRRLPGAAGRLGTSAVCRYTNRADGHFVIDESSPGITVVSACSGHGFKFAPVVGEIVACRVTGVPSALNIEIFLRHS